MQSIFHYFHQQSVWLPGHGRREGQNLSFYTRKYTYIHIKPTSYKKKEKILLVTVTIGKLCQSEDLSLFFLWQSNAIVYFYCYPPPPFLPPFFSSSSLSPPLNLFEFVSQSFCLTPSTPTSSHQNIHLPISLTIFLLLCQSLHFLSLSQALSFSYFGLFPQLTRNS